MSDTKTVAGHEVPAGVSTDLESGIRRYAERIAALGGYETRVRAPMPNGVVREGALCEAGLGGCQPALRQDDGRTFRILDLDAVEVVR